MKEYTFKNGHTVCFEHFMPDSAKKQNFTVVYTHGFCSDPWGRKPEVVKAWCLENGVGFFRAELAGHGSDKATFEKTTIETYKEQIFEIINDIIEGDIVLAGASLGGWLSLLGAISFPQRVIGVLGLAAAPDFLKNYIEKYFTLEHKRMLEKDGKVLYPTGDFTYVITQEMIESGYKNLLLDKDSIPVHSKVRLLQGMEDKSLYYKTAEMIASKVSSLDVKVVLMKNSNHRLNSDDDVMEIRHLLDDFLV